MNIARDERSPGARIWAGELIRAARASAVIFDMDGVLADTEEYHLGSWQGLLKERFGLDAPPELIRSTFGQSNENILPLLIGPDRLRLEDIPRLSAEKEARYRALARGRLRPLPGVVRFLEWLQRRGIPTGVGTSGPRENILFLLGEFGWRGLFRSLVDRSRFSRSKPHPDCFLAAAASLGVSPRRCLVFEDSLHGLAAARRAGSSPVAVATTFPEERLLLEGILTLHDFSEVAC